MYRINTDVVMTHDFPLSQFEEVSYIMIKKKRIGQRDINTFSFLTAVCKSHPSWIDVSQ